MHISPLSRRPLGAAALLLVAIALLPNWSFAQTSPEERLAILEAKVKAMEDGNKNLLTFLQIVTAIGTIIGFSLTLDRVREASKLSSMRNELSDKISKSQALNDEMRGRQEEKNNDLIDASRKNIEEASRLFAALGDMLTLQHTAQEMRTHIEQLQAKAEAQVKARRSVIEEQNRLAISIWRDVTRSNYASLDRQERFHEFSLGLNSIRQEFSVSATDLSAACYVIAGLDLRVRDISGRISLMSEAVEYCGRDMAAEPNPLLFPGMPAEEIRRWNQRLLNEALYHLAILHYNSGDYRHAVIKFEEAVKCDSTDAVSMMYIPEAKFLGFLVDDFGSIAAEFQSVGEFIERRLLTAAWDESKKKELLSQLWVRFGNCYYARSPYEPFLAERSLTRALTCYKKAHDLCPTYLAQLSYAQTLTAAARQEGGGDRDPTVRQARALFGAVFPVVREKLANTVEPKIRMMLYYMLAICVNEARIEGELPQAYLAQIHAEKVNLGTNPKVRIFSPKTKNDLTVPEFIAEVQEYQRRLPMLSTVAA